MKAPVEPVAVTAAEPAIVTLAVTLVVVPTIEGVKVMGLAGCALKVPAPAGVTVQTTSPVGQAAVTPSLEYVHCAVRLDPMPVKAPAGAPTDTVVMPVTCVGVAALPEITTVDPVAVRDMVASPAGAVYTAVGLAAVPPVTNEPPAPPLQEIVSAEQSATPVPEQATVRVTVPERAMRADAIVEVTVIVSSCAYEYATKQRTTAKVTARMAGNTQGEEQVMDQS